MPLDDSGWRPTDRCWADRDSVLEPTEKEICDRRNVDSLGLCPMHRHEIVGDVDPL